MPSWLAIALMMIAGFFAAASLLGEWLSRRLTRRSRLRRIAAGIGSAARRALPRARRSKDA